MEVHWEKPFLPTIQNVVMGLRRGEDLILFEWGL
jgi:hypothetical protein